MSLRLKIMLLLAVMAATATAAIGVVSYRAATYQLREAIDRSLDDAAARFTDHDGEPFGPRGPDPDGPPSFEQVVWQIVDANGNIIDAPGSGELPVSNADVAVASGERQSARHQLGFDGSTYRTLTVPFGPGAVILARSQEESKQTANKILGSTLIAVVVVAAVALALGWLLARQITRRLVRLTDAAGTVASTGRLDVSVPVDGSDETGQLGRAFSGMLGALQRSRDDQHQLVQDAGHELRTPLTSLRTNVSVLRRFDELPVDTRQQLIADLDSETRELTDLVDELVELATDRRDAEAVQRVELAEIAERVGARAQRRTGRDVRVVADESSVLGQAQALERAVHNLVDNACKFAPAGPIEVTVANATVTVRDHGPGLTEADIPHLFDRFYRAVDMRSRPGSGLGLSIVASVVEAHGGTVFARNATDGGAEIGFTLAVAAADDSTPSTAPT